MSRRKTHNEREREAAGLNLKLLSIYSGKALDLHDYECLACFYKFPKRPNDIQ